MSRRFEWDPEKARANERKHGVTFDTASFVFDDPFAILEHDRIEDGEYCWRTTGLVGTLTLLVVAHTFGTDEGVEIIRIISARRAERKERREYDEARKFHG